MVPQDADKLPEIISGLRNLLENEVGVDKRLPCWTGLIGFDDAACNVILLTHTTSRATRDFGNWRQSLLMRVHSTIAACGGALAYPTQVRRRATTDNAGTLLTSQCLCIHLNRTLHGFPYACHKHCSAH